MRKILLSALLCSYFQINAQWTSNTSLNTPVCTEIGKQGDPRILETADGGAYIAWKDWRNGASNPDIFLQRINAKGEVLWITNGLNLCVESHDQSTPNLTDDMRGGVIVTWSDWRSMIERDLYAQRVDSNGNVKWLFNGTPVSTKTNREHNEKIISDGKGGAIIIWEQQSGGNWDVWGNRLDSNGVQKWGVGGIALCSVSGNRLNPKVQSDKKGGAIVVWQDERSITDYDIYAQRVNENGTLLWGTTAIKMAGGVGDQIDPKIDPDPTIGGAYITWIDKRNGNDYDLYAQRVDSSGNVLWTANGKPICTGVANSTAQDMLSNTVINGVMVTWKDNRNGTYDIYAQKLDKNGNPVWATNGIAINDGINNQLNPNICPDGAGGAIIVFQDEASGEANINCQRIDSFGLKKWNANGEILSNAIGKQSGPKNCTDGKGGAIVVWEDDRVVGDRNIFMQHIGANGKFWPLATTNFNKIKLQISPNPSNGIFNITSPEDISKELISVFTIFGQKVEYKLSEISKNQIKLDISYLPNGIYLLTYKIANTVMMEKVVKE